ncbi:His-Xaa-Ser system protein HxsD [Burkholderia sp. BDU5]|uniref:His-Xaa-Ser system protein HxsD n=1 Tax=Burkholderia sp. BDU5 TaxID=1385590 RepID=UPI00075B7857|nr:His-Xaa-Ser system protein HxsD [Burkholderia sp. BDU5]KVE40076.1 hypothetical protein WS69_00155 [Burkholderia sp. BDU5]
MPGEITLLFDAAVYSVDSIQKAAYRSIHKVSTDIRCREGCIECRLTLDPTVTDAEGVAHEFKKEVLDQELRTKIAAETRSIRHLILALAFSRTGLIRDSE